MNEQETEMTAEGAERLLKAIFGGEPVEPSEAVIDLADPIFLKAIEEGSVTFLEELRTNQSSPWNTLLCTMRAICAGDAATVGTAMRELANRTEFREDMMLKMIDLVGLIETAKGMV